MVLNDFRLEYANWAIFRNMAGLQELHITGIFECDAVSIPPDLLFPSLCKLAIRWDHFSTEDVISFIRRHTALRSLQVKCCSAADLYTSLVGACHNLLHLEIEEFAQDEDDGETFAKLLESLHIGLRCLILPVFYSSTPEVLHAITQFHSHSLRCLTFCYFHRLNSADEVANFLNNLPRLHTLFIAFFRLETLLICIYITNMMMTVP